MKPAPFEYTAPTTIDEAIELLARHGGDARPLAGGQSLVPLLALRVARPAVLIDLNNISVLGGIEVVGGKLRIGAMTRQAQVLSSPIVAQHAPLLVLALTEVGHPPTRARGTIGGSLAHADPAAELPAAILALDAQLVVRGIAGERVISADRFFRSAFQTAIDEGELLIEVRIPLLGKTGNAFMEVCLRKGDFALAAVAARVEVGEEGECRSARLVLSAVADAPIRCSAAEELLIGRVVDERTLHSAAEAIPADSIELGTRSASRAYRARVAGVLAKRALGRAFARASGGRS